MIRMSGMEKSTYDEIIRQMDTKLGLFEAGEGDPHPKGTSWRLDNGRWSGKNSDGYIRSFDDQSAAQKHASGSEQDVHDPNYKRDLDQVMAGTRRAQAARQSSNSNENVTADKRETRKPGEVWANRFGSSDTSKQGNWGAKNSKGEIRYFLNQDKDKATAFAKGTTTTETSMKKESTLQNPRLKAMIKEEYVKITEEAKKAAPKIEKKLEDMRTELLKKSLSDFIKREQIGATFMPSLEKRVQIQTVAELIDVPVNELFLYFLNNVKACNERHMVEYRLGHVYFYGD